MYNVLYLLDFCLLRHFSTSPLPEAVSSSSDQNLSSEDGVVVPAAYHPMADNDKVEESIARGNDWEVVSLTASTYAAAPSPVDAELKDEDKGADISNPDKGETSSALFLSRHFAFHPAQFESRPLEIADIGVLDKHKDKDYDDVPLVDELQGRSSGKGEKDWALKGLSVPDEFPSLHFLDDKGVGLSVHGSAFEEGKNGLEGLKNLTDTERSVYSSSAFSSFHSEAASGVPPSNVENTTFPDPKITETSDSAADSSADMSHHPKPIKGDKFNGFDLPCGAWWKRRASSFYAQAKEANAFWSVFIAAAVMGLVMFGQRWQQERWQVLQLRWHLSINNE